MFLIFLLMQSIHSPSMGADFAAMDKIYAEENYPFHALKIGDVICYIAQGNLFGLRNGVDYNCHRIVNQTKIGKTKVFITKGDANENVDSGYVSMLNYAGKVQWKGLKG